MNGKTPNLLLESGLPEQWNGRPLFADFRNMIRFEQALADESLPNQKKAQIGVMQLFDTAPHNSGEAGEMVKYLLWFYSRGRVAHKNDSKPAPRQQERAYDFTQDSACILAAFWQAYGIDLVHVPFLHWWQFMALLENLPETTRMAQLMSYRTIDTSKIKDKAQRKYYEELKHSYALANAAKQKSVEEINAETHERVRQRFAQAKKAVETKR